MVNKISVMKTIRLTKKKDMIMTETIAMVNKTLLRMGSD